MDFFFFQTTVDWYYFMQLMEKEIPTFAGFFWADEHIDQVIYLKEKMPGYHYIIGVGTTMMGSMAEGFDSFSMIAMSLYPEMFKKLYDYMWQYEMREAYQVKEKLCKTIYGLFGNEMDMDYLTIMKMEMNKLYPFKMGPLRRPRISNFFWLTRNIYV